MIIKELKKEKKNIYMVTFDNNLKERLFDDLIIKYNLLPKKEITEKEITQIKKENASLEAYYIALRYLTTKLRTKKEIKVQLEKKEYSKEIIKQTIEKLEQEGYLKEDTYIRSFINDNYRFSNDGPLKIKKKLSEKGFSEEKINNVLCEFPKEIWTPKLKRNFQKKADSHHNDGVEKWKWKCIQYFVQIGYPKEWVIESASLIEWKNDINILKKEYEKMKRKWSRKYSGSELEFQIKIKLYEKGFQSEEINEIIKKES